MCSVMEQEDFPNISLNVVLSLKVETISYQKVYGFKISVMQYRQIHRAVYQGDLFWYFMYR